MSFASHFRASLGRWLLILLIGVVACLGVWFLSWIVTRTFGVVAGEEFSPELFKRRSFVYYEIPLIHIQVSPITRETHTNDVEQFLITNQYVSVGGSKKPRWDLIHDNQHSSSSALCDAAILCSYLDSTHKDGTFTWRKWTEDHPQYGKYLWPAVAEVARARCYIFVPDLIDAARRAGDLAKLQQQIDATLATKYRLAAENEQHFGRHERAIELFTLGLARNANDVAALRGRAKSLTAQGKENKAAADLAEARKLDLKRT